MGIVVGRFILSSFVAQPMCSIHTQPSYYFLYTDNTQDRKSAFCTSLKTCQWSCIVGNIGTYTSLWKPLRAQRCSSCPVGGSGNVEGCSFVGFSPESNLWRSEIRKSWSTVEKNWSEGKQQQQQSALSEVDQRCERLMGDRLKQA